MDIEIQIALEHSQNRRENTRTLTKTQQRERTIASHNFSMQHQVLDLSSIISSTDDFESAENTNTFKTSVMSNNNDAEEEEESKSQEEHQQDSLSSFCDDPTSQDIRESSVLHHHTSVETAEFCVNLLRVFRKANLCKTHSSDILQLIHGVLPQPNHLPTSMPSLLRSIPLNNLFLQRRVCTLCLTDLADNAKQCNQCESTDHKHFADVFDTDIQVILRQIIERYFDDIASYRQKILNYECDVTNDIPFQPSYRTFVRSISHRFYVTLVLHLDGISLSKSSKQCLWLLSCSITELPPHLRYKRFSMPLLSVWIGYREPIMTLWLKHCIPRLLILKSTGVHIKHRVDFGVYFYAVIADCPALKLVLNHIGHNGYFACWLCKIRGIHTVSKRQYYFQESLPMRNSSDFLTDSQEAESCDTNINGRLGLSVLQRILDVPLPRSILVDYMHVCLLRHTRDVVRQLYSSMKPAIRMKFDERLKKQRFPHTFHRRMRSIVDTHIKATEWRNLLLYGLLPLVISYIPIATFSHLALYVCGIRMLHGQRLFGSQTHHSADELLRLYYRDHEIYYKGLQNLVLHLHAHFANQYDNYGSLNYTSTFAQEDLIGYFAKNKHGTRYWGELLTHYYSIDYFVRSKMRENDDIMVNAIDKPFDIVIDTDEAMEDLQIHHRMMCTCDQANVCICVFRRCVIKSATYHSLAYSKRQTTVSYFVQYTDSKQNMLFGSIKFFFTCKDQTFALINHHSSCSLFSDLFSSSQYHSILSRYIDVYFHVLTMDTSFVDCVSIDNIRNVCIIFEKDDHLIATPISVGYEHD